VFRIQVAGKCCRSRHFVILAVLILMIGAQGLIGRPMMRWMLEQEVRDTAINWSAHIFRQIDAAAAAPGDSQSSASLAGAVEAALLSGALNRVDLTRGGCDCALALDGHSMSGEGPDIAERLSTFIGVPKVAPGTAAETAQIAQSDRLVPQITFRSGATPTSPPHTAEALFGRDLGGETYTLRLTFDVTSTVARLRVIVTMATLILTVTLVGAAILVARTATTSSRALQISEKQARFLAEHDPLTGLLNRFGFGLRAQNLLRTASARGEQAFLFQVDADKFKDINDLYGHATGDRVIQAIGQMLTGAFPSEALVARLGGDEFAVLVPAGAVPGPVETLLRELPTGTDVLADDGTKLIEVSTSSGLAIYPDDAHSLGDLMKASDLALYSVKAAGRNGIGAYKRDMTKALERRHWELDGIREAIRDGQLLPYYQPLIGARTGRVEGVEALVRWRHPVYGILSPDRFSHALSDNRVAPEITKAMLGKIADDMRVWRDIGYDFSVGLNIGEADLKDPGFLDHVARTLEERSLPARSLAIEITETALTRLNSADARPILEAYRKSGGFVALDDFGTGNSSITLLKDMPYSAIKIDRSFIRDLTRNTADMAIVRSLVALSHDLGFKIVAEGIETPEQAKLLRRMRVDLLQGFLYSRPVPAKDLLELLAWSSPPAKTGDPDQDETSAVA
jgi:diguanylate cyclase (GGDEF)-like protein